MTPLKRLPRLVTRRSLQAWLVVGLLLGTMVYALAEELTLSTLYPSPRGVYRTLRIGSAAVTAPGAQLHIVAVDNVPAFQIEDPSGNVFAVITETGRLGLGMPPGPAGPTEQLDIASTFRVRGTVAQPPKKGLSLIADENNGRVAWGYATYAPPP